MEKMLVEIGGEILKIDKATLEIRLKNIEHNLTDLDVREALLKIQMRDKKDQSYELDRLKNIDEKRKEKRKEKQEVEAALQVEAAHTDETKTKAILESPREVYEQEMSDVEILLIRKEAAHDRFIGENSTLRQYSLSEAMEVQDTYPEFFNHDKYPIQGLQVATMTAIGELSQEEFETMKKVLAGEMQVPPKFFEKIFAKLKHPQARAVKKIEEYAVNNGLVENSSEK